VSKKNKNERHNFMRDSIDDSVEKPLVAGDVDKVLEILRKLPVLRRYGDDENAIREAIEILEGVKVQL